MVRGVPLGMNPTTALLRSAPFLAPEIALLDLRLLDPSRLLPLVWTRHPQRFLGFFCLDPYQIGTSWRRAA